MMTESDPFETLQQEQEQAAEQVQYLAEVAQQWDSAIREGLQHLAQTLWPDEHLLELIPIHRYRLRHQITSTGYLWWVEHDIPPQDRYSCVAYRVQLALNGEGQPTLTVQSEAAAYDVAPLTVETLGAALARAGEDPPLVVPREMGQATDP